MTRVEQLQRVVQALRARGHQVELIPTTAAGSATRQAREIARTQPDILFACGGDGTLHEVLQGLVSEDGATTATLGILPFGSANALARHLRLSLDPLEAALQQIDGAPHAVPVGKLTSPGNTRYFTVMTGAGPDGALAYNLLVAQKSSFGRLAYYLHAARLFVTHRFPVFQVEFTEAGTDLSHSHPAVAAMALRVDDLGGIFSCLTTRHAGVHQPHLQLLLVRPPALFSLPLWFASGWLNLHHLNPFLRIADVTSFACLPLGDPAPHLQVDGESLGRIPMRASLVPKGLHLRLPIASKSP